jgi:hypothetical protein
LTDLGEMGNWAALVNNWRQVLVRWMRNYLAKFSEASIYRTQWRWRSIWRRSAGDRREGRLLAQGIRGFHRGKFSGDGQACYTGSLRRAKLPRHVAHDR